MRLRSLPAALLLLFAAATPALAQVAQPLPPPYAREINLSGPRFGFTMLSEGNIAALKEKKITLRPLVSQFGWQFERAFYAKGNGTQVLSEWIPLLSGLDQGYALPSLNWLAGIRSAGGAEFGIGPNISPAGVGLVVAAGVTVRSGALNVPLNFALVSSKSGPRVTIMTGFNLRR
jgi:hypothetical protein